MDTIHTLLTHLQKTSSVEPREVELLMAHALGKPREFILAHPEQGIMRNEKCKIKSYIRRREDGEPLAYILGHKEFFGYDFIVTPDTLIPRPETEILVEEILEFLKQRENPLCPSTAISPLARGENNKGKNLKPLCSPGQAGYSPTGRQVSPLAGEDHIPLPPLPRGGDESASRRGFTLIDIGTGSGCIITSIVKQLRNLQFPISNFQFLGVDLSEKALEVAKQNTKKHNIENSVTFLHSNLLEVFLSPASPLLPVTCHLSPILLVANLPYVTSDYLKKKKTELTEGLSFEPALALNGGKDGFDLYRSLLVQIDILKKINPNISIHCFFEIGSDQKEIAKISLQKVFPNAQSHFINDLSEQTRIVSFSL